MPPDSAFPADVRCGANCLYVALKGLDLPVGKLSELEAELGSPTRAGYTMAQLDEVARKHGAHTLGVLTSVENLRRRRQRFACVALIREGHFVLFGGIENASMQILDPPDERSIPVESVASLWNGTALLIAPEPLVPEDRLGGSWHGKALIGAGAVVALIGAAWWISARRRSVAVRRGVAFPILAVCWVASGGCRNQTTGATASSSGEARLLAPRIQVSARSVDMGRVAISGSGAKAAVLLSNVGTAPLTIREIVASCGCTETTFPKSVLQPGEQDELAVRLSTTVPGPRSSTIRIRSDDPLSPVTSIQLTWEAAGQVSLEPSKIELGVVRPGDTRSLSAKLRFLHSGGDGPRLPVKEIRCEPANFLSAEVEDERDGPELLVTHTAGMEPGQHSGHVSLYYGDSTLPDCSLPITWRVRAEIEVQPTSVFLGTAAPGSQVRGTAVISSEDGQRLELETFGDTPDRMRVSMTRLAQNRVLLRMEWSPGAGKAGTQRLDLQLKTISPVTKTIVIPVYGYVTDNRKSSEDVP